MSGGVEGVALLPCPFCGGKALDPRAFGTVECEDCGACTSVTNWNTRTAPPAWTYAEGVENAAKVLDDRVKFIDNLMTDDKGPTDIRIGCQLEAERGARAIRLLSQGEKA